LTSCREQAIRLNEARVAELHRVIGMLADQEARAYVKAFEELGRLEDRLTGYANIAQSNIGDIKLIEEPLKTVRFALPAMGGSKDSDPFLRHRTSSHVTAEAERMWSSVKQRLAADSYADLSDIL
jgi:hypothetical protein